MSLKHECVCGHDIDTHYKDLQTGERCACLGSRCDCAKYDEGSKHSRRVLPENNYDYRKTAYGGGRPHLDCKCQACCEWEYDRIKGQWLKDPEYPVYPDDSWGVPDGS